MALYIQQCFALASFLFIRSLTLRTLDSILCPIELKEYYNFIPNDGWSLDKKHRLFSYYLAMQRNLAEIS